MERGIIWASPNHPTYNPPAWLQIVSIPCKVERRRGHLWLRGQHIRCKWYLYRCRALLGNYTPYHVCAVVMVAFLVFVHDTKRAMYSKKTCLCVCSFVRSSIFIIYDMISWFSRSAYKWETIKRIIPNLAPLYYTTSPFLRDKYSCAGFLDLFSNFFLFVRLNAGAASIPLSLQRHHHTTSIPINTSISS